MNEEENQVEQNIVEKGSVLESRSSSESFDAPQKSGKGAVIGVGIVLALGIGVAGGWALQKFVLDDAKCEKTCSDNDSVSNSDSESELVALTDEKIKEEIDKKIDAYELGDGIYSKFKRLAPYASSSLSRESKLHIAFYYMKDDELKNIDPYDENGSYREVSGNEVKIPISRLNEVYKSIFNVTPSESDLVDYMLCGAKLSGYYTYDKENSQYVIKVPEAGGCGGTMGGTSKDSYRDKYEISGDTIYVTTYIGSTSDYVDSISDDGASIHKVDLYSDYEGGEKIRDVTEESIQDYVNESTKEQFTKYLYIFDKNEDGDWTLRGLYPYGVK